MMMSAVQDQFTTRNTSKNALRSSDSYTLNIGSRGTTHSNTVTNVRLNSNSQRNTDNSLDNFSRRSGGQFRSNKLNKDSVIEESLDQVKTTNALLEESLARQRVHHIHAANIYQQPVVAAKYKQV